jgi:hypothetical protein
MGCGITAALMNQQGLYPNPAAIHRSLNQWGKSGFLAADYKVQPGMFCSLTTTACA